LKINFLFLFLNKNLLTHLMLRFSPSFRLSALTGFLLLALTVSAQQRAPRETALQHLRQHAAEYQLTEADVRQVQVTDEYQSEHNQVTHVWVQQTHAGVPVFNALFGLHVLPSGEVATTGHRFVAGLEQKINTTLPSMTASQALRMAMNHLDQAGTDLPNLIRKIDAQNWVFAGGQVSREEIKVSACYVPLSTGEVRLGWSMVIDQVGQSDMWSIRVDAQNGQILDKNNRTVYCRVGHLHRAGEACHEAEAAAATPTAAPTAATAATSGTYRVFGLPAESPAHGARVLLTAPEDPTFSPFGWLDTNGVAGNEFTYTRGNNVWAYDDSGSDDNASAAESAQGGSSLTFDFPFDPNEAPQANRNAAITNLFYMNNMLHDVAARYGFTEAAGNFQWKNYGGQGAGRDAVRAEGLDGGGTDNANFATPADGSQPRMQMYLWSRSRGNVVVVNGPTQVAGTYFGQQAGNWGGAITTTPLTADVVVTNDGTPTPTLGCNPPVNDVSGKIVMVDRGVCQFGTKALQVEQAGGVACIICNFENSTAGMLAGDDGDAVNIPVLMMSKNNCDALRQVVNQGLNITLVQPPVTGPDFLDGDFDNGIIAHEYAHGISNRLTGGPSQADCLGNGEQMGEGWSDFFSLIMTVQPNDAAPERRGVGTYVLREPNDGTGIRRYPYSTDMSIAPLTFGNVAESAGVHDIGEVWNNMLWDLYWAMVDKYGFDANLQNTNSGNGRAIRLVMDGMKLQPCSPGFKDGYNAIFLADKINYGGQDTCLISQVFARRGLGYLSNQGNASNSSDGFENFDPIPTCIKELKIEKLTTTPTINPGETATFKYIITNHKDETVTGVAITDDLPDGLQFVSASNGGQLQGSTVVWNIDSLQSGQFRILTLNAKSIGAGSPRLYRDQMEDLGDWFPLSSEGDDFFFLQNATVKTGTNAWRVVGSAVETDMTLEKQSTITISGDQPILRFWTQYNTEGGADAGFLEFQKDGEQTWIRVDKATTFRNGYTGGVQYGTFAIPFLSGFSGASNGWEQAYVDMSQFAGETLLFRFRYGSNASIGGFGWVVDDVELLDLIAFDTEACVTSNQGDQACDRAPERGVILNPGDAVGTNTPTLNSFALQVQPNPATDLLYVSAAQSLAGDVHVSLIGADGRVALQQHLGNGLVAQQPLALNVRQLPAGMYAVRVQSAAGASIVKVMIR
jgi:extracellular elastinolytic metalloproteinase